MKLLIPIGGHYFNGDREAALHDYYTRNLGIDKDAVWGKYLRYLRDWSDGHSDLGFYGMTPPALTNSSAASTKLTNLMGRSMGCGITR